MKNLLLLCPLIMSYLFTIQIPTIKQGAAGKVYMWHGNHMPSPGQAVSNGATVSTTVFVYALTTREQAASINGTAFSNIKTKLIAKTQSDSKGQYAIALPAGKYSIFAEANGSLYANNFDDKGNINPIEVKKDSVSNRDIIISTYAVY